MPSSLATIQFDLSFLPPSSIATIEANNPGFFDDPWLTWVVDLDSAWEEDDPSVVLRGSDGVDAVAYSLRPSYRLTLKSPPAFSKFYGLVFNLVHARTLSVPQSIVIRDYLWEREGDVKTGDYVTRRVVVGSRSEPSGGMWDGGELRYTEGFELTLIEVKE